MVDGVGANDLRNLTVQVLIPFRGPLGFLREAVDSVRNSTGVATSVLVIDDRTENLGKPDFLDDSEYVFAGGVGIARALQLSKSHLSHSHVAILAGDDLADRQRFAVQLNALVATNSELCLCRMLKFGGTSRAIPSLSGEISGDVFLNEFLLLGPYGADGTALMTRNYFTDHYLLDPGDPFADWVLALETYPQTRISLVDQKLYMYRQHSGQVTRNYRDPWSQSGVMDRWARLCSHLDLAVGDEQVMQIVAAPWYRAKATKENLAKAIHLLGDINRSVRGKTSNQELIASLEGVILRRIIFRVTPSNFFFIFKELKSLRIPYVRTKFFSESLRVLRDLIKQVGFRPRLIYPENP